MTVTNSNGTLFGATEKKKEGKLSTSEMSTVGNFRWSDVLIPELAGKGSTKTWYQTRTLVFYASMYMFGLYVNQTAKSPPLRAAALGLLFPGAGLTTVATIPSILGFAISTALIPLALFAWFGCGGVFFPIFLWVSTTGLAAALAKDTLFEPAPYTWAVICVLGICFVSFRTYQANRQAAITRKVRNDWLVEEVQKNQRNASELHAPGSRELTLEQLRFVQWFIELGMTDENDWSYHTIIDQFQTSALRYQLYEAVNCLGLYQAHYAPGFHGVLSQAQRNVIIKSTTKKVMNFRKWESLLGKFNAHDWNPIKKDNIMVTGYLLQAIGIYSNNTGDKCFEEDDCLEFVVTENSRFKTNVQGINHAVSDNMEKNPYTLYPCEPNWHYTPCNLVAMGGIVSCDRALQSDLGARLLGRLEKNLEEEFTEQNGSMLPIRSELTGFTIPGLCGVMNDAQNSFLCSASIPHIAHRNWAMARREAVRFDDKKRAYLVNLVGADKIDPGNYKSGLGFSYAAFASAAAEFGDRKINEDFLRQVDEEHYPAYTTDTGARRNKGISTLGQGTLLKARLGGYQDWHNMLNYGPPETALRGPIVADLKFPDVLVAKAWSHDGHGLELIVYNGNEKGVQTIGLERLVKRGKYKGQNGKEFTANAEGKAYIEINVDGRTRVDIQPAA